MYKRILFSVDLDDPASWERALPTALQYCQAFSSELHVVTVVPELPEGVINLYLPADSAERIAKAARRRLGEFIERRIPAGFKVKPHIGHGNVYSAILDVADALDAGLIIMASHRPAMSDYLLGPNAAKVVRHASRSVLVVRG